MDTLIYFLVVAGLFLLMMRFGCGSHVMGHGHGHDDSRSHSDDSSGESDRSMPPQKDVDPVCGMTVDTATAKSAIHQGRAYYFCSQDCREKFEANPALYVKPTTDTSPAKEHHHGCC